MAKQRQANTVLIKLQYDEAADKMIIRGSSCYEDTTGAMKAYRSPAYPTPMTAALDTAVATIMAAVQAETDSKEGL